MNEKLFLRKVAGRVACDEQRAEALTFAVFLELRDRLSPKEAGDVAAQLPSGLKELWGSPEHPDRGVRKIHQAQFLGEVRKVAALVDDSEAERAVLAVFRTLQEALGSPTGREGESWDIFSQLPKDLKRLWLAARDLTAP